MVQRVHDGWQGLSAKDLCSPLAWHGANWNVTSGAMNVNVMKRLMWREIVVNYYVLELDKIFLKSKDIFKEDIVFLVKNLIRILPYKLFFQSIK